MAEPSTNLERDNSGKWVKGHAPNPEGKGGFQERPQDISPGGWKKEDSISYQYNYLMRMTPQELNEFRPVTMAQSIALKRLLIADTRDGLADAKEITDRTEGKASQAIDVTTKGESINPYTPLTTEELRVLAGK